MDKASGKKTKAQAEVLTPVIEDAEIVLSTDEKVSKRIHKHMTYSAGIGLIPIPIVDVLGLTALQIKMVRDIAKDHNEGSSEKFSDKRLKVILSSLLATVAPAVVGSGLAKGLRGIPLIGPIISFVVVPSFFAASTYAVGQIFHQHFKEGGDLTNFNAKENWSNFKEFFQQGKSHTRQMVGSFN